MNTSSSLNALDLIGEKIKTEDVIKAKEILQSAYGKEFDIKQFALFFEMIQEDNWTNERLKFAVKHLIKTNKYAKFNIADIYNIGPKLHGYDWFLEQPANSTEMFNINGNKYWAKKEDIIGFNFPNMEKVKSNKLQIDFSNAIAYYRQELKSEPTENEKGKMLEKIESEGLQYVIDKIDECKKGLL